MHTPTIVGCQSTRFTHFPVRQINMAPGIANGFDPLSGKKADKSSKRAAKAEKAKGAAAQDDKKKVLDRLLDASQKEM